MDIIVNTLVKNDKDQILMVQEAKKKAYKLWNFPAGHMEVGENIFEAAKREFKEETGYDIKITGLVNVQNCIMQSDNVILFMFSGEIVGGEKRFDVNEILDCKFIDVEDLLKMNDKQLRSAEARKKSIRKLLSGNITPISVIENLDFRKK